MTAPRESDLVAWFLAEADGRPLRALRLAVATCEAMARGLSRGYLRLPPTHEVLPAKTRPEPL